MQFLQTNLQYQRLSDISMSKSLNVFIPTGRYFNSGLGKSMLASVIQKLFPMI